MLEHHHLQKRVIKILVEHDTARYRDLKPDNVDGNVFTYHLSSLIKEGLAMKNDDGTYCLTSRGKLYGINSEMKKADFLEQAHSIILISIKNDDKWLLRKRLVQPMYGCVGFIHGEPRPEESIEESAARILLRRTGLKSGGFSFKGSGYIRIYDEESLVSFTHFSLIEAADIDGELIESDPHGENIWLDSPVFDQDDMIPSMKDIAVEMNKPGTFFLDKKYRV